MLRDLQYAWRLLRRSPGFTAVAVLTLAVGIGANTAVFSVLEAILLRPPAYRDADRLVVLERREPRGTVEQVSAPDWKDWRERSRTLEDLAAYGSDSLTLTGGDEAQRVSSAAISANLPRILGARPLLGRVFQAEDEQPGTPFSMLLSETLWRQRFGADPAIAGKKVDIEGIPVRIAGVMPASFAFPDPSTAVWLPLRISPREWQRRNVFYLQTLGKMKAGVVLAAAQNDLAAVAAQVAREHPDTSTGLGVEVVSLQQYLAGSSRSLLVALAGAVGLVLLLVCTNLVNLLLARASARVSEFAVRAALGASRIRLVRQLAAEAVLLSVVGGVAGVLIAIWSVDGLRLLAMERLTRAPEIRVDAGVLWFAAGITTLAGLVFGLAPGWMAARPGARDALARASSRATAAGAPLRALLVAAQVAMAFVLLTGAGLLTHSLWLLRHVNPGFAAGNVLTLRVYPRESRFQNVAQLGAFYEDLLAQIRQIPGVEAAGAVGHIPLAGEKSGTGIAVENRPVAPGESIEANYQLAGPGYFHAMGIPLVAGRDFDPHDTRGAPEAIIINQALANLCWPGQDAIGRHIRLGPNPKAPWATVVGVIGNVRHDELALPPRPEAYENYFQHGWDAMTLVVRHDPGAANVAAAIRAQIRRADRDIPVPPALAMDDILSASLRDRTFLMWMLVAFASSATLLAAIGIYGVMAYGVTRRTREIGIRIALGAQRRDVTRLVLRSGARMIAAGVAAGVLGAVALTGVLRSLLFGVRPADPATLAATALALAAVAVTACVFPAHRATRVEAAEALRQE